MERLLTMDKQEYVSRMQAECRRIMELVADAVNNAPTGNVISGTAARHTGSFLETARA